MAARVLLLYGEVFVLFFEEVGSGADAPFHELVAARMGRQVEEEILPHETGEVESVLPGLAIQFRGPLWEVGLIGKVLETGAALQLKGASEPTVQGDDLLEGVDVRRVVNRAHRSNGIGRGKLEDGGGELPIEVQAFHGDFGKEDFHAHE